MQRRRTGDFPGAPESAKASDCPADFGTSGRSDAAVASHRLRSAPKASADRWRARRHRADPATARSFVQHRQRKPAERSRGIELKPHGSVGQGKEGQGKPEGVRPTAGTDSEGEKPQRWHRDGIRPVRSQAWHPRWQQRGAGTTHTSSSRARTRKRLLPTGSTRTLDGGHSGITQVKRRMAAGLCNHQRDKNLRKGRPCTTQWTVDVAKARTMATSDGSRQPGQTGRRPIRDRGNPDAARRSERPRADSRERVDLFMHRH